MRIPALQVVIGNKGQTLTVRGAADTGYEGLASVRPALARRLGLVPSRTMKILTAAGEREVPVAVADVLAVQGFPDCRIAAPEVLVHDFPGSEDVLLGERFFEKFTFDIDYSSGRAVVTCGRREEPPSWLAPAALIGGLALIGVTVYLVASKS